MKRAVVTLLVLATILCAGDKKRKSSKPPDLQVLEVKAHRTEGVVSLDGRVRNSGLKTVQALTLIFKLFAPSREVVTTQRGTVDETILEPGDDTEFRFDMKDHGRAVQFTIDAETGTGRELVIEKPGPYPIE